MGMDPSVDELTLTPYPRMGMDTSIDELAPTLFPRPIAVPNFRPSYGVLKLTPSKAAAPDTYQDLLSQFKLDSPGRKGSEEASAMPSIDIEGRPKRHRS